VRSTHGRGAAPRFGAVRVAGLGDVLLEGLDQLVDRAVFRPALLAGVHDVDGLDVGRVGPEAADHVLEVRRLDHVRVVLGEGQEGVAGLVGAALREGLGVDDDELLVLGGAGLDREELALGGLDGGVILALLDELGGVRGLGSRAGRQGECEREGEEDGLELHGILGRAQGVGPGRVSGRGL